VFCLQHAFAQFNRSTLTIGDLNNTFGLTSLWWWALAFKASNTWQQSAQGVGNPCHAEWLFMARLQWFGTHTKLYRTDSCSHV